MMRTCSLVIIAVCALMLAIDRYRSSPVSWVRPTPSVSSSSVEQRSTSETLQLDIIVPRNCRFQSDLDRNRLNVTTKEPAHVHVSIRREE
ncbi:MAG: hypothetical protein G01um1014106_464 [Parcubacteria group bacterium Gr01-1014_106]|nr:MAG: hypothetical protein G01um1014106_464 [Parcubacteria group bacterium Gr01-1014_106]